MTKDVIQTFSYRISQASKSELVVILYDMATAYIEDAQKNIESVKDDNDDKAVMEYSESLRKCGRVIDLLIKGLDFNYDVSNQLFQIYLYIKKDLIRCLADKDSEELKRISNMIKKLRGSFYEVSKTDKSGPMMRNTQQVYSGLTYSSMGGSNESTGNIAANRGFTV